jgi:exopolyphosphatase/guanosine-5'-triphosphate,3'-diphosphate pyrophosphatase
MRAAILDLGTNTFNLLIADVSDGAFNIVHADRQVVKLGEKSINENKIAEAAFQRGLAAFQLHAEAIHHHQPGVVKVLATSAIREAENGHDFMEAVKSRTGLDIEIISGEKEAELIYYGNREAVEMNDEVHLIMDIGGGSTEFIIANSNTIFWKQSFKLGVARLLEKFKPSNPAADGEIKQIKDYLEKELQPLFLQVKKYSPRCLVGSAGAFETVVDMIGKENSTSGKSYFDVDLADYYQISRKTILSTAQEREQMPGLIPMRRDMIVLSYLLIDFVLEQTLLARIKVSTYSLKEGALFEIMHANNC